MDLQEMFGFARFICATVYRPYVFGILVINQMKQINVSKTGTILSCNFFEFVNKQEFWYF